MAFFKSLMRRLRRSKAERSERESKNHRQHSSTTANDIYMTRKTITANSIVLFAVEHVPKNIEIAVGYRKGTGYSASVTDISSGDILAAAGEPMPEDARIMEDEPMRGFRTEAEALMCLMAVTQKMVFGKQQDKPKLLTGEKCPSYSAAA